MDRAQTVDATAVPSPEHQTDIFATPSQPGQRQHATATILASLLDVLNDGTSAADNNALNEKTCLPKGLLDFDRSDSSSAPNGISTILELLYSERAGILQNGTPMHSAQSANKFRGHRQAGADSGRQQGGRASYSDGVYKDRPAAEQEAAWNILCADSRDLPAVTSSNRNDGFLLNGTLGPRIGRKRIVSDFSGQFSEPKVYNPHYTSMFRNGSLDCNCTGRMSALSGGHKELYDAFNCLPSYRRLGSSAGTSDLGSRVSGSCRRAQQLNGEAAPAGSFFTRPHLQSARVYPYLIFQGTTPDATEPYQTDVVKIPEISSAVAQPGCPKTFFCIEWKIGCLSKLVASSESEKVLVSPQFLTKTNLKNLWMMFTLLPAGGGASDKEPESSPTTSHGNFFSVQLTSTSSTTVTFGIECDGILWEENTHCFKDSPWSSPTMIGPLGVPQLEKLTITIKFYEIFSPETDDATASSSNPPAYLDVDLTKRVSAALPQKTVV